MSNKLCGTVMAIMLLTLAAPTHASQARPDNTKVNKQSGATADKQSQTKEDLALVKAIRQDIVKDKQLSLNAHNCKVITQGGHVTLRGPVNSQQEKDAVAAIAAKHAGDTNVSNELTIKPRK